MEQPTEAAQRELKTLLRGDQTRLGEVYRLLDRGMHADAIAGELGVRTSGFVANHRAVIRALLEGRLPNGEAISRQVGSAIRGLTARTRLSPETEAYVNSLLASLSRQSGPSTRETRRRESNPVAGPGRSVEARVNLREEVDLEVRRRSAELVSRIREVTGIAAIDYHQIMGANFALDTVTHLIVPNAASESTRALLTQGRRDLTLENAVLEWASDLPISDHLAAAANARLDWWRND